MALTSGLVAYYKLDESSGNASDSVGGFTATNNSVTYWAGLINNGGEFDWSASYFSMASNLGLNWPSQNYTYSLWVRPTSNMSAQTVFFNNVDVTYHNYNYIEFYSWAMRLVRVRGGIAADVLNVAYAMMAGTLYNLVATYDGSTLELSINDVSIGTKASSGNGSSWYSDSSTIWAEVGGGNKFDGMIDEVGVWNRKLSGAEKTELYNWWAGVQRPFSTPVGNSNFFMFM